MWCFLVATFYTVRKTIGRRINFAAPSSAIIATARSFTQWGDNPDIPRSAAEAVDPVTGMSNGSHILARGDTHLPFAQPRFGSQCAALLSSEERRAQSEYAAAAMGDMDSGMMDNVPADPKREH